MPELDPRAVDLASAYRCPDCNSEARLTVDSFGLHHLTILHDDTCPWLAAREDGHD